MATHDPTQLGEWLSAYMDGELDAVEAQRVEAILRENDEARRMLDELRRTAILVASLPHHSAPRSIMEEVRLHAEREELLGGLDPQPVGRSGGRGWWIGILSSAAVLAIVAAGGWYLTVGGAAGSRRSDSVVALAPSAETERPDIAHRTPRAVRRRRSVTRTEKLTPGHVGDGAATPGSRIVSRSRAVRDKAADKLLAAATIDQKLRAGLDVEVVRTHTFANEPVQLLVAVGSAAERDRVTARLAKYLSGRRVADVSPDHKRSSSPRRFYYAGVPNTNFAGADDREILVHATKGDLRGLVQQVVAVTGREDAVALVSGPLEIRGSRQAQRTLDGLARSSATAAGRTSTRANAAVPRNESTSPRRSLTRKPSTAPDQFLESLMEMLGLDEAVASAASEDVGEKPGSTAKVTADGGTKERHEVADGASASAKDKAANEREPAIDFDRPTLVSRRAKALGKLAEKRSPGTSAYTSKPSAAKSRNDRNRPTKGESASTAQGPPADEPVVTLVVRIRIVEPAQRGSGAPAKKKILHRPPAKTDKPTGKSHNPR